MVKDTQVNEHLGRFIDWRLNLWGESIDESIQTLHPLPDDHDDDHETAPGSVATTSVEIGTAPTDAPANPSDHIHRPVNSKPSSTSSSSTTNLSPTTPTSASSESSSPTPTGVVSGGFFPSFLPTFGVSQRTQIWIYGAFGLILLFGLALGGYFLIQRRRRRRNIPRDDYEFEVLDNNDDDDRGGSGRGGGGKAKRRAGELYDAFAGGSDEEIFSSDDEAEQYRDAPDETNGRGRRRVESLDEAGGEKSP